MKIPNFKNTLFEIEKDRGIKEEDVLAAIKDALVSAYKKRYTLAEHVEAEIADDGEVRIFINKIIVETVVNENAEISLPEAVKIDKDLNIGDTVKFEVTPDDFGRLAAQTAKQVIIQRIREAEKEGAFEEYINKIGSIVTGTIQNKEVAGYLVNLGRVETFLSFQDSIPGEILRPREKVKILIVDVKRSPKGPFIVISRASSELIRKLFEAEIPEISQGILEIKSIAREPGKRSKVAVASNDKNIGAVGTCVGPMGARIQNITNELGHERIDIIEWSDDPAKFISNALSPAKVSKVELNLSEKSARVILPEKEFSLAIGKEGQNVRLAAKLTGFRIDIVSEDKIKNQEEQTTEHNEKAEEKASG